MWACEEVKGHFWEPGLSFHLWGSGDSIEVTNAFTRWAIWPATSPRLCRWAISLEPWMFVCVMHSVSESMHWASRVGKALFHCVHFIAMWQRSYIYGHKRGQPTCSYGILEDWKGSQLTWSFPYCTWKRVLFSFAFELMQGRISTFSSFGNNQISWYSLSSLSCLNWKLKFDKQTKSS